MSEKTKITAAKTIEAARSYLFNDLDVILNVFEKDENKIYSQEEQLDILKTLILISSCFADGIYTKANNENSYKSVFTQRYVIPYEGKNKAGCETLFLEYFTYEGIKKKHMQRNPNIIFEYEECSREELLNGVNLFKADLRHRQQMVLIYFEK